MKWFLRYAYASNKAKNSVRCLFENLIIVMVVRIGEKFRSAPPPPLIISM